MDFNEIFNTVSEKEKANYLFQLLIKDDNLSDSANEYFIEMHKGFTDYAIEKISISTIDDAVLINTIKLFFRYFETEKEDSFKDIKTFEGLLLAILKAISKNDNVNQLSNITTINKKYFPQYALLLDKRLGNKTSWLKHAKQFYLIDQEIGHELLEHYYKEDINKYISTAKELFASNKRYWAEKLALGFKIEHDQKLYKDIYTRLCLDNSQISDYKKIKDILTETEKESLH